uniref:Anoctamin n=1 Tax=Heterorhabditis bacteriophora TaxID=37862 RepID=A0A1I7X9X1_HETBA
MAMAEQQWTSGYNSSGWNGTRSDHSVSKPIMVGAVSGNNNSQATSPRSESLGPGVLQMVVENVLSGSPASVNTTKFVRYSIDIIDERRADTNVGVPVPYAVPIQYNQGATDSQVQVGTPDFQVLFKFIHILGLSTENIQQVFFYRMSRDPAPAPPPLYSSSPPYGFNNQLMGLANNLGGLTLGGPGGPTPSTPTRGEQSFSGPGSSAFPGLQQHPQFMYMPYNQQTPSTAASLGSSPNFFGYQIEVIYWMIFEITVALIYNWGILDHTLSNSHKTNMDQGIKIMSYETIICCYLFMIFLFSPAPPLLLMMKDQFANYVVQKMLDVADSAHRRKMMMAIKPHIPALRKYNYGKHIITKLEKYFQKQNGDVFLVWSSLCKLLKTYSELLYFNLLIKTYFGEEREWREWIDEYFIHLISPNVYRTWGEAIESFKWFEQVICFDDHVGDWQRLFPFWERILAVYIGAVAMFLLSKMLKWRHKIDDERKAMHAACEEWMDAIGPNRLFMGGDSPNLADISLYGAMNSFVGCSAFKEVIAEGRIVEWHNRMKKAVERHEGRALLEQRV